MTISAAIVLPLYFAYSTSAFCAAATVLMHPPPRILTGASWYDTLWRALAALGIFVLAFGTAFDNLRTFAGGFASTFPDGVFELQNTTKAADFMESHGGLPKGLNYFISVLCFFAHEVLGATFFIPGLYLWACATSQPSTTSASCVSDGRPLANRSTIVAVSCGLFLAGVSIGVSGYVSHTATADMVLTWNDALGVYTWKSGDENPFGLFGVFLSSFIWILVGVLLWCRQGLRWFLAVQLVSFFGQGASASLGSAMGLTSNLLEQVVAWALIGLGAQLGSAMEVKRASEIEIGSMAKSHSNS